MSVSKDEATSGCSDCVDRSLEANYEAFDRALPRLLEQDPGRYALVAGGRVLDVVDTFTAACHAGYEAGLGRDFLVLKVAEHQGIRTALILSQVLVTVEISDGLLELDVLIRPDPRQPLTGQAVETVLPLRAMVDTGAESTVVCAEALERLGLHCVNPNSFIITASGEHEPSCTFLARMEFATQGDAQLIVDGPVRSLQGLMKDHDRCNAIIGLDVLNEATWSKEPHGPLHLDFANHVEL